MTRTVIIVGDSLGAPRPWEGVGLQSTYAFQLGRKLGGDNFIANYSASDNSTARSIKESFLRTYVRAASANYAVVHLGIVDCAPRLLSSFERAIGFVANRVAPFRPLFRAYVKLKSHYRFDLTRLFPRTLVPKEQFESNYRKLLSEIIEHNPIDKIFLINIAYPGAVLTERSYNILGNIEAYNAVIESFHSEFPGKIEIVDIFSKTAEQRDWITPDDGHHIYSPAHAWIADSISDTMLREGIKRSAVTQSCQ
jgi:lysophospholipase L1-like esterase